MLRRIMGVLAILGWTIAGAPGLWGEPPAGRRSGDDLPAGATARLGETRFENVGRVFSVAFAPDGKTLAGAAWDGSIRLWDVASRRELHQFPGHRGWVKVVAFSPDGASLASGGKDGHIRLWEAATGKLVRRLEGHPGEVTGLVYSPDSAVLASIGNDATLRVWDVQAGRETRRFEGQNKASFSSLAISPNGKTLAVTSGRTGEPIRLLDRFTGKERGRLAGPPLSQLRIVAFCPDGQVLASGGWYIRSPDQDPLKIELWDVAAGRKLGPVEKNATEFTALTSSPDGKSLAAGGGDDVIQVWEVATRQLRCEFRGPDRGEVCLAFSPDGRLLASGSTDVTALLWNLAGAENPGLLSGDDCERRWQDLASRDARQAYRAIWALAGGPRVSVPFIKERLSPVRQTNTERLDRLTAELDSERFETREKAFAELEKAGELAEPSLRKMLEGSPSLEVRRRVDRLLEMIGPGAILSPEKLRMLRAVETLERIGDRQARQVLEALAGGAPAARLTREAKAALKRLSRMPEPAP